MSARLAELRARSESGFTLIEMLVAAAMAVVVVGAASSMLISAVKDQPQISQRAQAITTMRWVLERMTREIRNGIVVYEATGSKVSFKTQVRRTTCGGAAQTERGQPAIKCKVTYSCTGTTKVTCTRTEVAAEGTGSPLTTTIVTGLNSTNVFSYAPSSAEPSYIGVTLSMPNPGGNGSSLSVSDGATLRSLSLPE